MQVFRTCNLTGSYRVAQAEKYSDGIYPAKLDVTDKAQIASAVENTIEKFGLSDCKAGWRRVSC